MQRRLGNDEHFRGGLQVAMHEQSRPGNNQHFRGAPQAALA